MYQNNSTNLSFLYYNNVITLRFGSPMPRNHQGRSRPRKRACDRHWQDSLKAMLDSEDENDAARRIDVGERLRELRTLQGLSIRSLAEMSGLNFNTLSLIENDKSSPSVSTLEQLAQALQVPIIAFFEMSSPQKDAIFQKSGQRPQAVFSQGLLEDLGAGLTLGEGMPFLLTLKPYADSGPDAIIHTGQEFIYCLEGRLVYTVAGEEHDLGPGDSLVFQAHLPHRWENRGNTNSRSLLILCPADQNDRSAEQHFKNEQVEG
ncbi:MAG: cupin domain-containing protein [Anaerolineales bacterium]|nr:cupin domain-containing protein [Anaerolineales bacterium]